MAAKPGPVRRFLSLLWRERLWWMIPILVAFVLVGLLAALSADPASAPFIYTLF